MTKATIICKSCGSDNPGDSKFCYECGTTITPDQGGDKHSAMIGGIRSSISTSVGETIDSESKKKQIKRSRELIK